MASAGCASTGTSNALKMCQAEHDVVCTAQLFACLVSLLTTLAVVWAVTMSLPAVAVRCRTTYHLQQRQQQQQ